MRPDLCKNALLALKQDVLTRYLNMLQMGKMEFMLLNFMHQSSQ